MKKGDKVIFILSLILILSSALGVYIYKNYNDGNDIVAIIKQNGKVMDTIDLRAIKEPKEWTLKTANGHYNVIRAEKGRIRMIDADCPDKICVNFNWISKQGESITCLPHKTIIVIGGKRKDVDDVLH